MTSDSERERERLLAEGPRRAPEPTTGGGAGEEPAQAETSWGSFDAGPGELSPEKAEREPAASDAAPGWGTFEPATDDPEDATASREAASAEQTQPTATSKPPLTTDPLPPPASRRSSSRRGYGYGRSPFGAGRLILPLVFAGLLLSRTLHNGSSGGAVFAVVWVAAIVGLVFWRMRRR
jgi:hypothetical protein